MECILSAIPPAEASLGRSFKPLPPLNWLLSILEYDPDTGGFTWRANRGFAVKSGSVAGCLGKDGYRLIKIEGFTYPAHRLAWFMATGEDPGDLQVDHRNHNRSDNRIENLRLATNAENGGNRRGAQPNSKTGIRGVWWHKRNRKFRATVEVSGKKIYLGYFADPWSAAAAYNEANRKYFGDRGGALSVVPEGFRHPETGELMVPPSGGAA